MMINCKICENSYCRFAKTDDSRIVSCSGYKAPKKPMTNADRIRAMSDEELAVYFTEDGWECHYCTEHERLDGHPLLRDERCDEKCEEHCLDWLRQPVKDGED